MTPKRKDEESEEIFLFLNFQINKIYVIGEKREAVKLFVKAGMPQKRTFVELMYSTHVAAVLASIVFTGTC